MRSLFPCSLIMVFFILPFALPASLPAQQPLPGIGQPAEIIDRPGEYETRNPNLPRSADDELKPPEGAARGIYSINNEEYFMPYYTAKPGDEAMAYFRRLVEKDSRVAEYWGRYAFAHVQTGKYAEAIRLAENALALDPEDTYGLYAMTLAKRSTFQYAEAAELYQRLLATDLKKFEKFYVTRPFLIANLADLYLRMNETEKAEATFAQVLQCPQIDPLALKMLDRHYLRSGRVEKALALYQGVLQKDPRDINALMNLGVLYSYIKNFPEAIRHLEQAVAIRDDVMKIHFYLHRAYYETGQKEKARRHLEICAGMDHRQQVELDYLVNIISPYPCNVIIYQQVFSALGDFEQLRRTHERQLFEDLKDAPQGAIQDDQFLDMIMGSEGYPEFREEDGFRYFFEQNPDWKPQNAWIERFRRETEPETESGRAASRRIARLLIDEKYEDAWKEAAEALKIEPDNLRLNAQAGIAAASLKRYDDVWRLFEHSLHVKMNLRNVDGQKWYYRMFQGDDGREIIEERDEISYLARVFTILAITDSLFVKVIRDDSGEVRIEKTPRSAHLSDEQAQKLGQTYQEMLRWLDYIQENTDSLTARAFAALMKSDTHCVSWNAVQASKSFEDFIHYDPDYKILYALYQNYGVYFGY